MSKKDLEIKEEMSEDHEMLDESEDNEDIKENKFKEDPMESKKPSTNPSGEVKKEEVLDESLENTDIKESKESNESKEQSPDEIKKDEPEDVIKESDKKDTQKSPVKRKSKMKESPIEADEEEEFVPPDKIKSLKSLDKYIVSKDNAQNVIYMQDIPDVCKEKPCMLGVDEAGRGPVLGPMVYGISFCPLESKQVLIDLGCADSKQLTEEKREVIFQSMQKEEYARSCVGWAVELISPNTISTSMYKRSKYSLNELSMGSAIGLINLAIDAGVNIAEVYVDTVGPPEKYQEKLKGLFPQFQITVAKKADSTYPIVSAASICAKVTRDHALQVWQFPEGLSAKAADFGSGYPGDPVTKRFLTENIDSLFGFPRLVRFSWSTAENALADKAFDIEFDEPDSEKPKYAGPKLTKFFKETSKTGEIKREQCRFFKERFLNSVIDF